MMPDKRLIAPVKESGQSLVELAVVLGLLVFILVAVVDLGRAYFIFLALQDAAAEGAAYGAIHPSWHGQPDLPETNCNYVEAPLSHDDPNNITYRVQNESPSGMISWTDACVSVEAIFPTPGNTISVTVVYDYQVITPLIGIFVGDDTIPVRAQAAQTILSSDE